MTKRRDFIKSSILAIGAPLVPAAAHAAGKAAKPSDNARKEPNDGNEGSVSSYRFLTYQEIQFTRSVVDHFVPEDKFSPSGTALGLDIFIDNALSSDWGAGGKMYTSGPWPSGTDEQGYQLPLTPRELYRAGVQESHDYCMKQFAKPSWQLSSQDKELFLRSLLEKKLEYSFGNARIFFDLLYGLTKEGLFSDPMYGGNRNKAAWKMIGFPGVVATHGKNIKIFRNKEMPVNPLSISDVV